MKSGKFSKIDTQKELEEKVAQAEALLETSDKISKIIESALELCNYLRKEIKIDEYVEVHSLCLQYFFNLRKSLSNKDQFTDEQREKAFYLSLNCPHVLPRLYIAFIVACSSHDESKIHLVSEMLPAVSDPLRGFLLRDTAISFFPRESPLLVKFAVTNFSEMLYLLPSLLKSYPTAVPNASGWLTSNISISLSLSKENPDLLEKFLSSAKICIEPLISGAVIKSVITSMEPYEILKYIKLIIELISLMPSNDTSRKIVLLICEKCKNPRVSFDFLKQTSFFDTCAIEMTSIAIEYSDIDVLEECANQWPVDEVLSLILNKMGTNIFAKVIPELKKNHPLTYQFVLNATSETSSSSFRKVFVNELKARKPEMDQVLCEMMIRNDFSREFINDAFADPFVFSNGYLLKLVVFAALKKNISKDKVLKYIDRSFLVDFKDIIFVLIDVLPPSSGNEIASKLAFSDEKEIFNLILAKLVHFDISESSMNALLDKCTTIKQLERFCMLASYKGYGTLVLKASQALLNLDTQITELEFRFDHYFIVINLIIGLSQDKEVLPREFINNVLNVIYSGLECVAKLPFPIATENNLNKWKMFISRMKNIDHFHSFNDQVDNICSLLSI